MELKKNEIRYREAEQRLSESVGLRPTERLVRLGHTGSTVRIQEVGEGPAVLFVHGISNSGSSWAPLVARMNGFRCLILDRPGCGLSEPLTTTFDDIEGLGRFADTLIVDVLDALELERAHVVATSFGGYIALRSAAAHPDRISRMIEFGWLVGAPIARVPLLMRLGSIPTLGRALAAVPVNERAVRSMFRRIGLRQALEAGRVSQEMLDWFVALLRDTDTMRNEIKAGPRIIYPLRGMNQSVLLPASLLAAIQTPVYFLWGEEDPFGHPAIARGFVPQLPNAELELMPAAGHAVWIDDPDKAALITHRFLGKRVS